MAFSAKRWWKWIALVVIGLVAVFVYYSFNPSNIQLFPKCPFFLLTGLKCPGCGSQRAIHCLLHLEVAPAFRYNALLVFSIPVVLLLLLSSALKEKCPAFHNYMNKPCVPITYLVLVLAWWILRNLLDF
ncbi:MAG: DUF2752 domain-containing protein [Paludibacteraceae bacterium]|nr:DUF2752 domain-containing protein [Paludibacteraceae bacterium]